MLDHDWQGNVRELANAMEYAWIVAGGQPITPATTCRTTCGIRRSPAASSPLHHARELFTHHSPPSAARRRCPFPSAARRGRRARQQKSLADVEMEYILQVYAKNNMNKQATATELGISLKTLYNKLHKYEEERRMRAG